MMSEYLSSLKGALEQGRDWLDDAILCARKGDKAGAAENVDDALPWLKTAADAAEKLTGGSDFAEQLKALRQSLSEMEQPYDVAALEEARRVLDAGIPEGVSFDEEEDDDERATVGTNAAS
jgi:hypothetical protein